MLLAGFDQCQQPLLTVLTEQRKKVIEAAARCLHLSGCWSCRGHPAPKGADEDLILEGHEIFCLVSAENGSWRASDGIVLVGQSVDLDPSAFRVAKAVDKPALRDKCAPGVLYMSVQGKA